MGERKQYSLGKHHHREEEGIKVVDHFNSVTRFGQISPFWPNFEGLFSIWRKKSPTFGKFCLLFGIFYCYKWLNIEYIILPSGHTAFQQNKPFSGACKYRIST